MDEVRDPSMIPAVRPGPDPALVGLLERIAIGAVAITARALTEAAGELTFLQWRVLVVAADHPDGVSVGEIGRLIGASPPSATRVVRRMERQRLVVLARDEDDRRRVRVGLTGEGRRIRDAVMQERSAHLADLLARSAVVADAPGTALLRAIADAIAADA